MKKIVSITLVLMLTTISAWAYYSFSAVAPSGQTLYYNINYNINSGTNTVTVTHPGWYSYDGYTYPTGALTIPSTVTYNSQTYSVTSIGYFAFRDCSGLTSVTIPNSVTSIGGWAAFEYCSGLTSVTIPNSVTSIGSSTFAYCSSLTSVTIPNSVTSIGWAAFRGCSGLTSVTIPNSVTEIGDYAFYDCSGLTSVTIPNSVTSIGIWAFYGCSDLTSVTIPNSVTSIGDYAFWDCRGLTSVTMEGVTPSILGNQVFNGCTNLTSIHVPCPAFNSYNTAANWSVYSSLLTGEGSALNRTAEVTGTGTVNVSEIGTDNKVHITVTPGDGFVFQSVGAKVYSCDGETHLNDMILFEDEDGYWFNMPNEGLVKVSATFVQTGLNTIDDEADLANLANGINNGTIANGGQGLLYELTANIAISGTMPGIGTSDHPFRGIFHGNGHNVTLNGNALFGVTDGATIENVHIAIGSSVVDNSNDSIGAVVNRARNNTTIRQCSNHGTVSGRDFVGGICGRLSNNSFLQDCWNTGAVGCPANADAKVGALCGEAYYSFVTYSFSSGTSTTNTTPNNAAGLVGRVWTSAVQYCYFDKQVNTCQYIFHEYNAGANIAHVGARNTENLKGTALQERLGVSGHWTFADGQYPQLDVIANTPQANLAASPLNLYSTADAYDRVDHVTQGFEPCWEYGLWSSDSPLITFEGSRAVVAQEGEPQWVTLTLSDGELSHSVELYVLPGGQPIGDPLGIDNPWDDADCPNALPLTLMPNPASGKTTVQTNLGEGELQQARLEVYNMQGQKVMEVKRPQSRQTLDLSTLPHGTYMVRLVGASNGGLQKLIVQ